MIDNCATKIYRRELRHGSEKMGRVSKAKLGWNLEQYKKDLSCGRRPVKFSWIRKVVWQVPVGDHHGYILTFQKIHFDPIKQLFKLNSAFHNKIFSKICLAALGYKTYFYFSSHEYLISLLWKCLAHFGISEKTFFFGYFSRYFCFFRIRFSRFQFLVNFNNIFLWNLIKKLKKKSGSLQ